MNILFTDGGGKLLLTQVALLFILLPELIKYKRQFAYKLYQTFINTLIPNINVIIKYQYKKIDGLAMSSKLIHGDYEDVSFCSFRRRTCCCSPRVFSFDLMLFISLKSSLMFFFKMEDVKVERCDP